MRRLVLALLLTLSSSPALAQIVRVQLPIGIRVEVAPPQLRVEVAPPAPSPAHAWVPGYWSYSSGQYVWVPGAYVVAPQPAARWVAPRWILRDGGWYFEPGRWESAAVATPPPGYPQQAYPPPSAYPPPRPAPAPRPLTRDEAVQRAYEITARHGLQPRGVKEVESGERGWRVEVRLDAGEAKVVVDPWSGAELRFEAQRECRPNQYWDGEKCRHKGKGHGARKHDDEDDDHDHDD